MRSCSAVHLLPPAWASDIAVGMRTRQSLGAVTTMVAALLLTPACKKEEPTRAPAEGEPARRAAKSFVHCVEAGGSGCVDAEISQGPWDAFSMLGWLASGSPLSILMALPRELEHHKDPRKVQRRFVEQVGRQRETLRGAECRPERVDSLDAMVPKLSEAAQQRLTAMGLWSGELDRVVSGLAGEASRGLSGGYLVSMRCQGEPFELYVATTTEREKQVVVGLLMVLPEFLGGAAPNRNATSGRLRSISLTEDSKMNVVQEGAVDAWVSIPVEEF